MINKYYEVSLSEDYQLLKEIDFEKNKSLFYGLNVIASIVLVISFLIGYRYIFLGSLLVFSNQILLSLLLFIIYIFFHEAVHALVFKCFHPTGKLRFSLNLKYASASMPAVYFYKKPYILIGLAPFILFSILFTAAFFLVGSSYSFVIYLLFVLHVLGCGGDLYVCIYLLNKKSDTLINDFGTGMNIYSKK